MRFDNSAGRSGPQNHLFKVDATRPLSLLRQCPVHAPTPFVDARSLAREAGLQQVMVKNEATRMRLGSFKALGGAFAVAQMILDASGETDPGTDQARATASGMTFITASAGNHGLSVAAGARIFGAKAAIVLAEAVPEAFAERIRGLGAEVIRSAGSYEDSVAHAMTTADENGWLLLADGSWPGYIERPALIMEGYTVLADEIFQHLVRSDDWPDHVFLQAGVGGLAASVAAHIRLNWPQSQQPRTTIVEPDAAPCLMKSVQQGGLTAVTGPVSNMGRLDCKDASLISFEALKSDADDFITVSDDEAKAAADMLTRHGFPTTPSGAAGWAGLLKADGQRSKRALIIVSEGREDGG